jgi:hypothetical protein
MVFMARSPVRSVVLRIGREVWAKRHDAEGCQKTMARYTSLRLNPDMPLPLSCTDVQCNFLSKYTRFFRVKQQLIAGSRGLRDFVLNVQQDNSDRAGDSHLRGRRGEGKILFEGHSHLDTEESETSD